MTTWLIVLVAVGVVEIVLLVWLITHLTAFSTELKEILCNPISLQDEANTRKLRKRLERAEHNLQTTEQNARLLNAKLHEVEEMLGKEDSAVRSLLYLLATTEDKIIYDEETGEFRSVPEE